jgi:uncharacterized protein YdaU (DUF1376 family)
MSGPAYMAFYPADYLAATGHLTPAQHGAYLLLIMHYWVKGSLPTEDHFLARIVRMSEREWQRHRAVIAAFFTSNWKHVRIEEELEKARTKSKARAQFGALGGAAKALKDKDAKLAKATVLLQQNPSKRLASSSEPEREDTEPKKVLTTEVVETQPSSDPIERLWRDGIPMLLAISDKPDKSIRSIIGKWLRDTNSDAASVMAAIQRAHDEHAVEPVAFITRLLNPRNPNAPGYQGSTRAAPRSGTSALTSALAEIVERDAWSGAPGGISSGLFAF